MLRILLVISYLLLPSVYALEVTDFITVPNTYVHDVMTTELTPVECLALNIYHEARGESLLGQQLVAQVTMNRVRHNSFPSTVCGVVTQRKQFSWTHDGIVDHPYDRRAYETAYLIAVSFVYLNYHVSIHRAELVLNYHASSVRPDWPRLHPIFIHENHIFYARRRDL